MEEGFDAEPKVNNEPGKSVTFPVFPKEEDLDEEFDKMMEERYKTGSGFVTYAEDDFEAKRSVERNYLTPSAKDPTVWKVKCMVGRERHSAFCLMQKFVDLQSLGTKLKIISAFAVEHVKGFIFIEADKQCDINEACKGLCSIYSTRVAPVPKNEISHLLSVRNKYNGVSEGMWVRVKNGTYKGDLAQVVAVNEARKKATIKLIPRIDLRSMAQKFGGGVTAKKSAAPAPKLISSSELEEFRPLIQYRRDRDTGKFFEVLDSLMLKDGYLYKKVSIDSLNCSGVLPTEEELLKFKPSEINESGDMEWLLQLYGEQKKKQTIKIDKGGAKGEGSSSSTMVNSFELFDLVCFGRKDFGLIIGMEKDDHYKILKNDSEGSAVVTLEQHELKSGSIDKKFTALDQRMKTISINDTVRVLEGPSKDRQGIVRHVYRGTIFLYDENETENSGYFCCKSQTCEKIKLSVDASNEKGGSGASGFEDFMSSPKSPLSPKKPWQARENNSDFNRGDKDGMFSIGQTLRIRIGPLKGYLCRVLAIRHSDVTVKLDSQQKVLTVKCEHLSEVRGKSSSMYTSDDPGSSSLKPFDLLGTDGSSRDWTDGAGTSAEGDGWNAGGLSAGRGSWPSFSTSGNSLQPESTDLKKDVEDTAWESKVTPNQNSSWGTSSADKKAVASDSWGKAIASSGDQAASSKDAGDSWGQAKLKVGLPADSSNDAAASWGKNNNVNDNQDSWKKAEHWDKGKNVSGNSSSNWGDATSGKDQLDSWGKGKDVNEAACWEKNKSSSVGEDRWSKGKDVVSADGSTWGKAVGLEDKGTGRGIQEDSWGKAADKCSSKDGSSGGNADWNNSTPAAEKPTGGWGNAGGSWSQPKAENADEASGWGKGGSCNQDQTDSWKKSKDSGGNGGSWNKQDGGSSWGKQDGESSWGKQDGGSSWSKEDGGGSFNGDRGSGGRRGRGGGRGGRDQFGRGRSFDQGPSSGWSKEGQENNWTSVGMSSGNASGLTNDQAGGWGKSKAFDGGREDGWKKPNATAGDNGPSWNKECGADKEIGESGDKWNSVKPSGGNNSSTADGEAGGTGDQGGWSNRKAWNSGSADAKQDSGWGKKSDWNSGNAFGGNKSVGDSSEDQTENFRGSFGGRDGSDRGGFRGRGGSDRGGFGVRGRSDRGGYGGRGNWNSGSSDAGGNKDSDWSKKSSWNSGSADASQDSGWGKKSDWNSGNAFGGNQSVGGTSEDQTENFRGGFGGRGGSDRGGFGGRGRSDRGGYGGRGNWNSGSSDAGGNKDSDWSKKSSWNSGSADASQDSGWGKKSDWNSGNAFGGNQSVGGTSEDQTENFRGGFGGRGGSDRGGFGGRGRSDRGGYGGRGNWNSGSSDAGGNKDSDWGKKSSWNSGSADASQDSGWGKKSDWNSGNAFGGNQSVGGTSEDQTENFRGGFGGRAGSDRGGFRGRGRSDRGGYGGRGGSDRGGFEGRGGSDRGGFGGRGGSDRGGFGGRGRGRRDWNNSNDSGEDKPFDWKKGANNNGEGWKSNDGAVSWNQGGGDQGQSKGWNSGRDGTSNQAGGWNSKGSGWSQTTEAKDAGGSNDLAGSWNKGTGSTYETGGSQKSWNSGRGGNSNQAGGWNSKGSGWNQTAEAKDAGGSNDLAGGWNKGTGSTNETGGSQGNNWKSSDVSGGGGQQSSWNQSAATTKEVKGTNDQGGGWNKASGGGAQAGGWDNKGSGSSGGTGSGNGGATGDQANALNQSKDTKEGTNGGGSWGKPAAASSWGKGNGSGQGGW